MPSVRSWVLGCSLLTITPACERTQRSERLEEPLAAAVVSKPKASAPTVALDVSLAYPITESVGAKKRIHLEKTEPALSHSPPDAWKIDFEKTGDFGGICWKNKLGNEGQAPGDDLSKAHYRRISFWAKGAAGGEVAEFRAGGLGDVKTRYRDSFDVTAGKIRLTPAYSEYSIYVNDVDLSSVMTVFCVLLHREDNPAATTIFLDDIQYVN
jgi:hypothetical protein